MNCCSETVEMVVPARHREPTRSGEAGGPPGNRRVLDRKAYMNGLSQRELVLSLLKEHPRTHGRTGILFALAALRSVPQASSQFHGHSRLFLKHSG